ncbi:Speckle-type POZ protein [Madurella mycetomatis]|uniref:Speckle-type POZ protein n=1 Tax=Madurella mycetomatis TaxID=100816 RepID=A0A175WH96_9PEZI|nr:Speckle-type POZ protein [Madurella mycetomatis]
MFARRFEQPQTKSYSKPPRAGRSSSFSKESGVSKRRLESRRRALSNAGTSEASFDKNISPIVTLVVGQEQRIFAAHENVLCISPFFQSVLQNQMMDSQTKKISLPDEEPEVFSSILEYLYKGDYTPRLVHNKKRNTWELEQSGDDGRSEATIYHHGVEGELLKDTAIYCAADKYGIEELKRVSLRKQGLQSGIQASTILASARYAYANTPDTDSKLRAHYLALIIRSRSTFKRSGTMQLEMFNGGTQLFFDLFVALCNHVDDISSAS